LDVCDEIADAVARSAGEPNNLGLSFDLEEQLRELF